MISDDGIDILLELAGHTAGNRLDVMSLSPSPISITYIGYPHTTGMENITYRFTDHVADPSLITDDQYVEILYKLPGCFLTYSPNPDSPPVADPPCLIEGVITFGSFNNMAKITDEVIEMWCMILKQVPRSRMFLKGKPFASERVQSAVIGKFRAHGIDAIRIDLVSLLPATFDHLSAYNLMDISLDTYPYAGTTTTFEALWMGVPVVTMVGDTHASRVGASILTKLDKREWICNDKNAYVTAAVKLAQDVGNLKTLRRSIRNDMRVKLCDGASFVKEISKAYEWMYARYAAEHSRTSAPPLPPGHDIVRPGIGHNNQ